MIRLSGNMRLTRQLEHPIHIVVALRILNNAILGFVSVFCPFLQRLDLTRKILKVFEKLWSVNFTDFFQRYVWGFMFEAAVDVDLVIGGPASMSESLNGVEFKPFGRLSVVNLEGYHLAHGVCSSTDNHHEWAQEKG